MSVQDFVHLHLHTEYSLLDGANKIAPLISTAKGMGMSAVSITDHGNLFGAIEFYQKTTKAGLKPIIGCEVYLAPRSRFDKEGHGVHEDDYEHVGGSNPYYHLILLAANHAGYKNLIKLVTLANIEGFYYKPRVDKEILRKHHDGLIALSGCLRGEIPYLLTRGHDKEAVEAAHEYQEIFGKENFFIEIQDNGLDLQIEANRKLVALAKRFDIPLVATNDCHYLHQGDARAHDVMLCLQTGKTINMPNRMKFQTEQLYFKSAEEMTRAFTELPDAVTNTARIADMVDLKLEFGKFHLPHFKAPDGTTREAYLASLSQEGLENRLNRMNGNATTLRPIYEDRLKKELDILNAMGYAGYFLIVWDIINYARASQIPVGPGRGSAAGSLVAYALAITDIDPISNGLIFERFLNPERVTLPDIDMDFCMDRREEVLRYVTEKYGTDHVSQIITFGTMAAKGAIRDVGRVLEIPYVEVDRLAKLIPNTLNITLDEALTQEKKLGEAAKNDARIADMIGLAKQLEGLARHASTHAAGVVISDKPLTEHVPLYRGNKGEIVTQFAMGDIEKIGLVKFDFLGLRTLTVIDHALRLINKRKKSGPGGLPASPLQLENISLDDSKTYALLGSGDTTGIFQLESSGMVDLLIKMKPETFEDIVAILALYRPGPIGSGMVDDFIKRKQGKKKIRYELPQLQEILKETYGVIVYQEQVMKIANVVGGFSLGEADLLRRAMGKKKPEEMAAQKVTFMERATGKGITASKAEKIFDLMEYFAGYGFNKSHSAAYALITFQTAYLKTHHPAEFMTALLSCEMGNSDKIVKYITECRKMGIEILPPDVNESNKDFTVVTEGIRFGLGAIKNVGSGAIDSVLAVRQEEGRFVSLFDFCRKIDLRKTNKRVIESLIKSGAFDSTKSKRAVLMGHLEQAIQEGGQYQRVKETGQMTFFGDQAEKLESPAEPPLQQVQEWSDSKIAKLEKEALGFYITCHPLKRFEALMKKRLATPTETLESLEDNRAVRFCGMVVQEKVTITKRGDRMAYIRIEDLSGSVEVIVFPDLYQKTASLFKQDIPLLFVGTVDRAEKGVKMKATAVVPLQAKTNVTVALSADRIDPREIERLHQILLRYPGSLAVYLKITIPESAGTSTVSVIEIDSKFSVDGSDHLTDEIETCFGVGAVQEDWTPDANAQAERVRIP